jgi:hypothetical protein
MYRKSRSESQISPFCRAHRGNAGYAGLNFIASSKYPIRTSEQKPRLKTIAAPRQKLPNMCFFREVSPFFFWGGGAYTQQGARTSAASTPMGPRARL